jgi:branched-chain amino acid transport system permease protein
MWLLPLTQAFAIVILGGLGSLYGTILAAVVVGFLDRFVAFTFDNGEIYVGLITIAVILTTLVVRPSGLLGKAVAT